MTLELFLAAKPLFYEKIDYERFPRIFSEIKDYFTLPKIIHIVGTNGKGSTGRGLAHLLLQSGKNVGHYTSPHILKFNERIWFNGSDIDDEALEKYHQKLQNFLTQEQSNALSYFEYTTLLAMLFFCETCEYIILEAGLGGEYDATNVFDKTLSIITPIGFDHEAFLGDNIFDIAKTKINSVRSDFILAKQYEKEVYQVAYSKANELGANLYFSQSFFDDVFYDELKKFIFKSNLPEFLIDNFSSSFCAFSLLGFEPKIALLDGINIFGRCQKITSNITVDVGHNPMAAEAVKNHFNERKVNLVYNSYNDKEYHKILSILKPIIKQVLILPIENVRAVEQEKLIGTLEKLGLNFAVFEKIQSDEEYLVFGSFSVVEKFLKGNF